MRREGAVFVLVLLSLFLATALGMGVAFLRVQGAKAARERALLNLNLARVEGAKGDVDLLLQELSKRGRSFLEARASRTPPYLSSPGVLASHLQGEADALTCSGLGQGLAIRIYFGNAACGEGLPPDMAPPLPPSAQRYPVGAEVYEIPFVGRVSSALGENRKAGYFRGSLRFLVGRFPPSFFQGFFVTAFRSDGSPSFFDVGQVWDGPVYVAAPPNFGRPLGPYFLAGFATARCPAPSGNTCATAKGKPSFLDVGAVDPEAMYPSPLAPCYGPSCPEFGGGVDWDAPAFELPPPSIAPTVQLDTSGGRARVRLELATLPDGTSGQLLEVTTVGNTTSRYLASPSTVWLEARAGENLLAQAVQSTVGWSQSCAQPMGASGGMLTLRCRDTYYGQQTPITPSQRTWRVSFEANADSARGCVQVGFRTKRSIYPYYTWYGTYNLGSPPGRVCPGEGWKQVTATLTLHSDTQSVLPWIQIDDNPPHSGAGTAYVRNLSLQPVGFTHYQQLGTSAVFRFAGTGGVSVLGSPDRPAWHADVPLALVAERDLLIEGNLFSSAPPCRNPSGVKDGKAYPADCTSTPDRGMLSLVSESGDVRLSTNTPATVHLHAAIYAPQGAFGPEALPTDLRSLMFQGVMAVRFFDDFTDLGRTRGWLLGLAMDPRMGEFAPLGWPLLPWGVWGAWAWVTWEDR